MNKIGYKNFRKFTDFPEINLGGITILVGGNNAGKSTLVKGMLLMRDFILSKVTNTNLIPVFSFDTEHASIGNFRRAFCRNSEAKEDTITFSISIEKFDIKVDVKGDRSSDMQPMVSHLKISDTVNNVDFVFDYIVNKMSVRFGISGKNTEWASELDVRKNELEYLKSLLSESKNLEEITMLKDKIAVITNSLKSLNNDYVEKEEIVTIDIPENSYDDSGWFLLPELIMGFSYYVTTATTGDKRSAIYRNEVAKKNILNVKSPLIEEIAHDLDHILRHISIEYIYAHSVSQQVFYNREKDNDYVTKTIHEYYQSRISEDDYEYKFIREWMLKFEIGHRIEIIPYEGEAYRVKVYNGENKDGIDLADMGMGSIQMTILLLRIATMIRKYWNKMLTILLEEPEQNLHPALQSKLADLLYEINESHGFNIVVETHSEYLIRRSQVIVAKEDYDEEEVLKKCNPFVVYYFDSRNIKKPYYPMEYELSGAFKDKFGEGFFDEASKWDMKIIRKEFELKKKNKK